MLFHLTLWNYNKWNEITCNRMKSDGITWNWMELHVIKMEFHSITYNTIQLHAGMEILRSWPFHREYSLAKFTPYEKSNCVFPQWNVVFLVPFWCLKKTFFYFRKILIFNRVIDLSKLWNFKKTWSIWA